MTNETYVTNSNGSVIMTQKTTRVITVQYDLLPIVIIVAILVLWLCWALFRKRNQDTIRKGT